MNARKRIAATLAMLATAATLSLTAAGTANAETANCPNQPTNAVDCKATVTQNEIKAEAETKALIQVAVDAIVTLIVKGA